MRLIDYCVVIIVLLFAMALRIIGIGNFGRLNPADFPSTTPDNLLHLQAPVHPDEFQLVTWSVEMILKDRLNPNFFEYPSGLINLNYVLFRLTGVTKNFDKSVRQGVNIRTIAPFNLYFFTRMYSVLGGVLSVACAYGILRRVSGRYAALVGALLVATAYLQVQHAHYAKPGIPSTALMMLALWANMIATTTTHRPTMTRMLILAGFFTGAAATVRYNAAAISIVLCLTGILLFWRHRNWRTFFTVMIAWGLFPLVFFIGTPFAILDFADFYQEFQHISGQFLSTGKNIAFEILTTRQHGFLIMMRYLVTFGMGIPASIAIAFGVFGAWKNRQNKTELLLIGLVSPFLLAYIYVTMRTIRPIFSDNLLILIIPFCLLFSAIGVNWLYENSRLPKTLLAPLLIFLVLLPPLSRTIPMVSLFSQTDTRIKMQEWIYQTLPRTSRIYLLEGYNVPLDSSLYSYEQNFNIISLNLENLDGFDYLILSDARLNLYDRADELVTDEEFQRYKDRRDQIESTYPRLAWIEQPIGFIGSDNMMNTMPYWHYPSLIIYCLNDTACSP